MLESFLALSRILTGSKTSIRSLGAGKDVRIILSQFQSPKGGLEASITNKGFVFDHKKVVVSSMNWSGEGILDNRDAGIIIDNATAAEYWEKIFLDDWNNHAERKIVTPKP